MSQYTVVFEELMETILVVEAYNETEAINTALDLCKSGEGSKSFAGPSVVNVTLET